MGNRVSREKIQDFRYVNGRQYHNEPGAPYIFPADLEEIDRQQQQHYCFKHIFKSNMSAPVERMLTDGCKVLDVGCGAGIWLLELSTEYVKSEFVGVDMSPVFPVHIKPFNANFIRANVLNGLPFPSNEFDYIHLSFMHTCFKDDQWQNIVIPELVRVLKPNGWLEFYEIDILLLNCGPMSRCINNSVQKLILNAGQNPRLGNLYKRWLSSHTCLKNISEIVRYPYIGEWKGQIIDDDDYSVSEEDDIISEECENTDNNNMMKKDKAKRKEDVKLGKLLEETLVTYYVLDSENLSNCMGVTKEEFLDIVEKGFKREMREYDTKLKFIRVICRKQSEEDS